MPQIRTYDTPALGLRPTETGINATAAGARRVGGEYSEAAGSIAAAGHAIGSGIAAAGKTVVGFLEHREISAGAAAFAQMQAGLTKAWNETAKNADPNDPSVAAKFQQEVVEPTLGKFGEGFITEGGQNWALSHSNSLRQHLQTKADADMSTMAGHATVTNQIRTINSLSATVHSDPSSLDYSLGVLRSTTEGVVGSSPNLTPAVAAHVRSEVQQRGAEAIIKSAAMGHIERTGELPPWIEDPKYSGYVNGAELKQFAQYAKSVARSNALTEKQLALYQRQQQAEAAHTDLSKLWTDSVTFDAAGKAIIKPTFFKDVMAIEQKYPGAATERARSFINWAQSQQRERREIINTDPGVKAGLIEGMSRTDDSATTDADILSAAAKDQLSPHDTSVLLNLRKTMELSPFKGRADMQAAVKEKLGVGVMPDGHQRFNEFMELFMPQYLAAKKEGKLPPNALSLKDPDSMISQAMKDFVPRDSELLQARILRNVGGRFPTPEVITAPAEGTAFVPPGNWQWNPARRQYRDPDGNLYDATGKRVKK